MFNGRDLNISALKCLIFGKIRLGNRSPSNFSIFPNKELFFSAIIAVGSVCPLEKICWYEYTVDSLAKGNKPAKHSSGFILPNKDFYGHG